MLPAPPRPWEEGPGREEEEERRPERGRDWGRAAIFFVGLVGFGG
jgi:hypothetical protein